MDTSKPYPAVTITRTSLHRRINFSTPFRPLSWLHACSFSPLSVCNDSGCGGAGKRAKMFSNPWQPISTSSSSPPLSSSLLQGSSGRRTKNGDQQQLQKKNWNGQVVEKECAPSAEEASISVRTIYQNGDPLGRRELGKCVVRWISKGMRSMAAVFASAEIMGEFSELRQRLGQAGAGTAPSSNGNGSGSGSGDLAFVIHSQPYLSATPMPKGLEAICFKACTHYPTLFDHFQRELCNILQDFETKSVFSDWQATESWKLLKEFASSAASIIFPTPSTSIMSSSLVIVKMLAVIKYRRTPIKTPKQICPPSSSFFFPPLSGR